VTSISLRQRRTIAALVIADSVALVAAGLIATLLRFGAHAFQHELSLISDHPGFLLYSLVLLWSLAFTFDLYRPENWPKREQLLVRLAAFAITFPIGLALGTYLVLEWQFGRGLLALTVVLVLPLIGLVRVAWLKTIGTPAVRNAVIVGEGPIVDALISELARHPLPPFNVTLHLKAPNENALQNGAPSAASVFDLVIVANLNSQTTLDRLAELNFAGTSVTDAAGAYAALTGRIPVLQVDSRWFIATGDFSALATSPFHRIRRILDLLAAGTLLLLTFPILILVLLLLLLVEGRPLLYTQTRLGQFRRPFTLYKLRTMRHGAEDDGPRFAATRDHRTHPLGRTLRRWRIDELPQLVNVIRGEMSLVGPRPERPELATELEQKIPFYAFRYSVKPGITGWAQVNLPYCARTEEHMAKLEFDLYSLRHYGPGMYLMVLLRTIGALVLRPGR